MNSKKIYITAFLVLLSLIWQDTKAGHVLKVHFLYGSKPKKEFKNVEGKWFGGKLGGHVGIEGDSNRILNFVPANSFIYFARKVPKHGAFIISDFTEFYSMFGAHPDSVKRTIIHIPVSDKQKTTFDSLSKAYLKNPPYDYAFFGMRCGAAGYDVLARVGVLKKYSYKKTYRKTFYPKKLRRKLLKKATEYNWKIERQEGGKRRKWEQDD